MSGSSAGPGHLGPTFQVRIHVRRRGEGRGLSSAVLLGFGLAKHPTVLCMDADLQHEPEAVPAVAGPVLRGEADFSVVSFARLPPQRASQDQ